MLAETSTQGCARCELPTGAILGYGGESFGAILIIGVTTGFVGASDRHSHFLYEADGAASWQEICCGAEARQWT